MRISDANPPPVESGGDDPAHHAARGPARLQRPVERILLAHRRSRFMKKAARPGLAIAAIFPAAMVPIALPALQTIAVSDVLRGVIVGVLLGASLLLITLALKPRPA